MLTPGMYEGFRLPDGRVPKKVAGNAVQRENDWLNDETYLSYMWRLYDLAVSVFEWKNLPKGVNERMVERWLLANGIRVRRGHQGRPRTALAGGLCHAANGDGGPL